MVALADLVSHPRNYRAHPPGQVDALRASLRANGVYRNVVASSDRVLLAGHGVVEAAKAEGLTEVPVVLLPFAHTDPRAERVLVADNELQRGAEDDETALAGLLADLQRTTGLEGTGWDDGALDTLIAGLQAEEFGKTQLEDAGPPEPLPDAITQTGDVWLMGEHRLVCGDCTDGAVWEAVMQGRNGSLLWTDPPYGIAMAPASVARDLPALANDNLGDEDFMAFLVGSIGQAFEHCAAGSEAYVCCDWRKYDVFKKAMDEVGWPVKNLIVWNKRTRAQNLNRFAFVHEFICYSGDMGPPTLDTNVWECDREYSDEHLTPKPVALVGKAMGYSSSQGDIVADPFMGSGTTLIAAEQLGRVCYGIELEPRYVDVAVRRWQNATGRTATLEATGEAFPIPPQEAG
jgi:DNA modification methylase